MNPAGARTSPRLPSSLKPLAVTVVGAGVVGLTVARRLARSPSLDVRVVADRVGPETPSHVAGAVWFPYLVAGDERVLRWARTTYRILRDLAEQPETGVLVPKPSYWLADSREAPEWARALPDDVLLRWLDSSDLPPGLQPVLRRRPVAGAWCFDAPVVDPVRHLEWLVSAIGPDRIEERRLESLRDVRGDVVVHCTGRRARHLTADEALEPGYGLVLVRSDEAASPGVSFADDRDAGRPLYAIVRGSEVVLGGCNVTAFGGSRAWSEEDSPEPDAAHRAELLQRLIEVGLLPGADPAADRFQAEWRPVRRGGVRLEEEGRVVHCYGHGGAGFTLAAGCAEEVVSRIERRTGRRQEAGPQEGAEIR